jgi:hypothetical protein
MSFLNPDEEFHHYAGAEAFIGDIPMSEGAPKRYVKFKIHTVVMAPEGEARDSSQWIFIPLDDLDQFSAQLAAMSESAKRWSPGSEFQTVGENIGVMNTTGKHD